ncbi:unnamed protein product [Bathycoccus prasinos]
MCSWNTPSAFTSVLQVADLFQAELCNSQRLRAVTFLDTPQEVLLFIDDGFEDRTHCGIGCRFMRLDMALWYAYSNSMTLHSIPNGSWEYTSNSSCPSRNHECYFQSFASDPVDKSVVDDKTKRMINTMDAKKLKANSEYLSVNLWSRASLDDFRKEYQFGHSWLKENNLLAGKTGCWVAAQLLFFLLKPTNELQTAIENEKRRLNWHSDGAQCIAVHVRHGARARSSSNIEMSDYMESVRRYPGTKRVLLITENQEVIKDAESNFPEYEWLYTKYPRQNKFDIGVSMSKGDIDPSAEAFNALVNLFLSIECNFFVGRVNSTWYRLMIMLAYGKYGRMPPFDNLLEDWGHGGLRKWGFFGMCTLEELRGEVRMLRQNFPWLVKMDFSKIV